MIRDEELKSNADYGAGQTEAARRKRKDPGTCRELRP